MERTTFRPEIKQCITCFSMTPYLSMANCSHCNSDRWYILYVRVDSTGRICKQ